MSHPTHPTHPHRARLLGIGTAVLAGVGLSVQARITGELASRLHDGVAAALISFTVGLIIIAALAMSLPAGRREGRAVRRALRAGELRPFHCLGGLAGAFLVASQGLTVATLGVAIFTVAVVAGQSASGLAVDRLGLGPSGSHPLTTRRVTGAALAVAAVLVAVASRLGHPATLALALLPLLGGVGIAWQQAVNGRVRVAGGVVVASFINFIAGTAALAVAFAISVAVRGTPAGSLPGEPLLYLGGVIGLLFIALAAALVRVIGVLLLALATVAGQLVGALLIDLIAPAATHPVAPITVVGIVLALVAVGVAASRRRGLAGSRVISGHPSETD